jgi:hypothetical protein
MEWLEIIKVQGAPAGYRNADIELLKQLNQGWSDTGLKRARVYTRASVADDLVIALTWETGSPGASGSTLALSLARAFREHGLVDHSVWVERLPQEVKNT